MNGSLIIGDSLGSIPHEAFFELEPGLRRLAVIRPDELQRWTGQSEHEALTSAMRIRKMSIRTGNLVAVEVRSQKGLQAAALSANAAGLQCAMVVPSQQLALYRRRPLTEAEKTALAKRSASTFRWPRPRSGPHETED